MYTSHRYPSRFRKLAEGLYPEPVDNVREADRALVRYNNDDREYLQYLFGRTGDFGSETSTTMKRLLPGSGQKISGNAFLKLAQYTYQFATKKTSLLKMAAPIYHQAVFLGFRTELEKIAVALPRALPRRPLPIAAPKTWHISETGQHLGVHDTAGLSPGVAAMRAAADRQASSPGIVGRLRNWAGV